MGLFDKLKGFIKPSETSTSHQTRESSFKEQLPDFSPAESAIKPIKPPKTLEAQVSSANSVAKEKAKRLREKETMIRLDKHAQSERYYLVEIGWMNRWISYLKGGPLPGPITNALLLDEDKKGLMRGLNFGEHFKVFNQYQWEYIQPIYGGGPALFTSTITSSIGDKRQYDVVVSRTSGTSSFKHSRTRSLYTTPLAPATPIVELTNEDTQPNEDLQDEIGSKDDKSTERIEPTIDEKEAQDLSRCSTLKISTDNRGKMFRGIVGLENPGLFCYLNTGIQICISIERFRNYFLKQQYDDIQNEKFKLYCTLFHKLFMAAFSRDKGVITPLPFWKFVTERFPNGRMHDLPEFLRYIFSHIEAELHSEGKNFIRNLFEGTYQSCITCSTCNKESKITESFLDLPIDLTPSLISSLRCFTSPELIKNDYDCESCKIKTSALKTLAFSSLPDHLILQVKRFKPTPFPHKLPNKIKYHKKLQLEK
jgi:hypothetical protein